MWSDKTANAIDAFGFEVLYDSTILQYTGTFVQEVLSRDFDFFDVNEPQAGHLKVGGFTTRNRIEAGTSGRIVPLEFLVLKSSNVTLSLVNLVDDLSGWATQPGLFENTAPEPADTRTHEASPQLASGSSSNSYTPQRFAFATRSNASPPSTAQTPPPLTVLPKRVIETPTGQRLDEFPPEATKDIPPYGSMGSKAYRTSMANPDQLSKPPKKSTPHQDSRSVTPPAVEQPQRLAQNDVSRQADSHKGDRLQGKQQIEVGSNGPPFSAINTVLS